jgi:hypothetical protein
MFQELQNAQSQRLLSSTLRDLRRAARTARFNDSVQTGRLATRQKRAQFQHGRGGGCMSRTVPPPSPATNRETFLGSSYFER